MEIKSKFEQNNKKKQLVAPFIAVHKSGNTYLFPSGETDKTKGILIVKGDKTFGEVGSLSETTFVESPDDWRVIENATITVTEE